MKRALLLVLLSVAMFGAGHLAGRQGERDKAVWAVTMAQAEAAEYKLAAVEIGKECAPKRGWFKR